MLVTARVICTLRYSDDLRRWRKVMIVLRASYDVPTAQLWFRFAKVTKKKRPPKGSYHKADFDLPKKQKEYEKRCSYSFSHTLPARYSVLHLLGVLSGGKHISEMFCCRET